MKNKITDKLFELAYTDSMTEVQNRNAYEEKLKKLRKPSSNISRITVIVIDINGMKEINDSYGHFSGDDAIKTVAKALKDTIGTKADIYRIGGDELSAYPKVMYCRIYRNSMTRYILSTMKSYITCLFR